MKGIILYQSKYGATKKYAGWLAEETGFDYIEIKKAALKNILEYDTLIFGGGIYASGIAGLSFLRKYYQKIREKKILVFCVGASPYVESEIYRIKEHNLKGNLKEIPLFYCRGSWEESTMGVFDRTLCNMLRKSVAKMDATGYEPWMEALMSAAGQNCDWTEKKYLEPLFNELCVL